MQLTESDRGALNGAAGPGVQLAMKVVCGLARAMGADRLIDVSSAHVDGCFYVGPTSIDFVRRLVDGGATVAVPTTLNVGSVDLLNRDLRPLAFGAGPAAAELMSLYGQLGCAQTWTCTPYQLPGRPEFGAQIAWGESNAIVFANSVLGARTNRYGDFVDIAAAVTGRAPSAGLHLDENRRADIHFRLGRLPRHWYEDDSLFALLGHLIGARAGSRTPVITGIDSADEDQLKALGAAAASSGSVALFHLVGVTPEAPTFAAVTTAGPLETVDLGEADLLAAWRALCSVPDGAVLGGVCLGTPHFSIAEFAALIRELAGRAVDPRVPFVVSTSRSTVAELDARGWRATLADAGVRIVTDTCTYNSRVLGDIDGAVVTNSAKWAWYGPANIGAEVVFARLADCVTAGVEGVLPGVPA